MQIGGRCRCCVSPPRELRVVTVHRVEREPSNGAVEDRLARYWHVVAICEICVHATLAPQKSHLDSIHKYNYTNLNMIIFVS